ncbi:MAG: penicillin-binding transpeptidase domain-containing protein [Acidobacteriota bacterium]
MVVDYKDYSKGFRIAHRERRWGRYLLIPLALAVLCAAVYIWVGHRLSTGRKQAEQGQLGDAEESFQFVKKLHIRGREAEDGLGVLDLMRDDITAAQGHLLGGGRSVFDTPQLMASFTSRGLYAYAALYGEYAREWNRKPAVAVEYAAALAGLQKYGEAAQALADAGSAGDPALASRREAVRKALDASKKSGLFCYVADRANTPLASYARGSAGPGGDVVLSGGLRVGEALSSSDFHNHTLLNIDKEIQDAASSSLGYAGALVAIAPSTGEILAAVSNPPPGDHSLNFAFEGRFEPGSIIKLLTLSAALRADMDMGQILPFKCTGMLDCDGVWFYDWAIHREVRDIEQATAESCNVAFARMGIAVGREALKHEFELYGFGRALSDHTPPMALGQVEEKGAEKLHTAHLSVGLDDLTLTTLHGALIAAALAGDGVVMMPQLVREKRNILQEPYFRSQAAPLFSTGLSSEDRRVIAGALNRVVGSEKGTGRRAAIEGFQFAMKTGTSGNREFGLDSVIIGFAPLQSPKIAFCLYAHGAGKAELEGARIVREFLLRCKGRLQ